MTTAVGDEPEILERSPEEGARRLSLAYLDQAAAALPRLADPEDGEALHDARVALRRLRSCLGSYAAQLGDSVPKKVARRLRRLAQSTGPGRDAEVQIAWLRAQGPELGRHHRQGRSWLLARLEQRMDEAYEELRGTAAAAFVPIEDGLRRKLSVYRAEVRLDESRPPSFGEAAAEILRRHAAALEGRLARIDGAGETQRAHRARISAKRLRYLAEPLGQLLAARLGQAPADPVAHRIKDLQDLLGELHDAHVMEAELRAALGEAAAERSRRLLELALEDGEADPSRLRLERRRAQESGLLALARLNRSRRDRLFGQFAERWQGKRVEQLLASVDGLAAALRAAGRAEPPAVQDVAPGAQ